MKFYLKLVHMEVHRFRYLLGGLMALTILMQFGVVLLWSLSERSIRTSPSWSEQIITYHPFSETGKLTFNELMFSNQFWFVLPVLISIAVIAAYVFLIWYRDWLGRDTFIYRLLMLPGNRGSIYAAKLTAILLFTFGLVSFQLLLLPLEMMLFNLVIPEGLRDPSYLSQAILQNQTLKVLYPGQFDAFVMAYGIGILTVLAAFTVILLERSYRVIGIGFAVIYVFVCGAALLAPVTLQRPGNAASYLYPGETYSIMLALTAILILVSVWLSIRLLNKKITV
ncbi:hypothetical protein [Paenibacillus sp. FSL H8-0537]|uniref:hypothetical protein n=1 Tax=Paenibacillus sp. FSL H8-0537 TaxID=2921399 RepID=UPI003100E323